MAWCRQAASHYLSQCWPRSIPPHGITRPQWVKSTILWLTHWGRVTHICVSELATIGSNNGLSPGQRQAIIWTNVGILLTGPLGTNFSEIVIEIHTFSFKETHLKISSIKWRPFCLGLDVLTLCGHMASMTNIIADSGNRLSFVRYQAFPWTNADFLSIGSSETNLIQTMVWYQTGNKS